MAQPVRGVCFPTSSDVNGGTIAVWNPYSSLDWVATPHCSWALPVDERRVPSSQTPHVVYGILAGG